MAEKISELQKAIDALDSGEFDSNSWSVIKKVLSDKGDESWTAQEQADLLGKFHEWANSSPEAQKELRQHLRDTATQRFTKQNKPFFNAVLHGVDIATALGQINTSNNQLKALVQPSIAGSPGEPQALKNQLANAQQGGLAAARAIAPAKQQIQQSQQIADTNAAITSGGNQANYGANVQANALGAERAASQLPMIQDTIQSRYQSRADQLAGQLAQNQQQDYGNRLFGSQLALHQYNQMAQAYGHLGATGRLNLRNTLQGVPDTISGIMGQATPAGYGAPKEHEPPMERIVRPNEYGNYSNYAEAVKTALSKGQNFYNDINKGRVSYLPPRY